MNKYPRYFESDNEVNEISKATELAGARTFVKIAIRRRDAERKLIEDVNCKLSHDEKERRMGIISCLNWFIELPEKTQGFLNRLLTI